MCRRSSGEYEGKEGKGLCGNVVFWSGEIGVAREGEREGKAHRLCDIVSLVPMRGSEKLIERVGVQMDSSQQSLSALSRC
jgi:hypothetical protein